jgi:phage/conjugal plasmid C-4 type zinc finger TraR family protein
MMQAKTMAGGWSRDGAVQDQIDASIDDAVQRVRSTLPTGKSLEYCRECGEKIPQARREAVPGVQLCINCQAERDRKTVVSSGYNRRGSKDSQLR